MLLYTSRVDTSIYDIPDRNMPMNDCTPYVATAFNGQEEQNYEIVVVK